LPFGVRVVFARAPIRARARILPLEDDTRERLGALQHAAELVEWCRQRRSLVARAEPMQVD
jgi:hypothetical protein